MLLYVLPGVLVVAICGIFTMWIIKHGVEQKPKNRHRHSH